MTSSQEEHAPSVAELLFGDGTPKKAFLTAIIVGTVLTIINHGDGVLAGELPPFWKVALTYCVPYCVTSWGAYTGKRAQIRRARAAKAPNGAKKVIHQ
ncbi:nitrate/nitrite transporter NrtS [Sulfitobacter aestuariivivens]|uniref:Nitrate/nitrite transporter NrtS n=1 Tax=Sulfitobacter aestuariivivens TaxID=2766981 RepID=A0A927D2J5_9RHOB|nr:nitrate/nitrite transporter NrtS [Sulfitobacter aestuariivivens]MBD3662729.1 nitrate/nitrite transporter NrtS [Sulfitobacter aestuariivivens]